MIYSPEARFSSWKEIRTSVQPSLVLLPRKQAFDPGEVLVWRILVTEEHWTLRTHLGMQFQTLWLSCVSPLSMITFQPSGGILTLLCLLDSQLHSHSGLLCRLWHWDQNLNWLTVASESVTWGPFLICPCPNEAMTGVVKPWPACPHAVSSHVNQRLSLTPSQPPWECGEHLLVLSFLSTQGRVPLHLQRSCHYGTLGISS